MIILDIETTGTDSWAHSIVSIGAIDYADPKRQFYAECRIWDGAHIMEEALAVNGFSEEGVQDATKKSEEEIVRDFISWAESSKEHTIAGQNPQFDVAFIQSACKRYGLNFPFAHRIIDLHSIVYFHMIRRGETPPTGKGRTALNSDMIMEYVGIPAEPKPHVALNGAKWEAEAFSRLLYGKSLFEEFKQHPIPWLA